MWIITDKYDVFNNDNGNGFNKVIKEKGSGRIIGYTKTITTFMPANPFFSSYGLTFEGSENFIHDKILGFIDE